MLLQQQEQLQKLEADQQELKARAAAAESEAAAARQELARTKQALEDLTQAAVIPAHIGAPINGAPKLQQTPTAAAAAATQTAAAGAGSQPAAGKGRANYEEGFRLLAGAGYVHGSPNFSSFGGAISGTPGVGVNQSGSIDTAEIGFDGGGVRAGFGYATAGGWGVGATYAGLFVRGSDQIGQTTTDLDNVFANGFNRSLADNNALNGNFDDGIVDFASQDIDLDQHVLDIDAGRHVGVTDDL